MQCSWMDDQFSKLLLEGLARIPNIKTVSVSLSSKASGIRNILSAFEQAKLFTEFHQEFMLLQWSYSHILSDMVYHNFINVYISE